MGILFTLMKNVGRLSLLLPRLPELPNQCYSNGAGNLDNLGSNKTHLCFLSLKMDLK